MALDANVRTVRGTDIHECELVQIQTELKCGFTEGLLAEVQFSYFFHPD